ncbi:HesB/IscA family protein [Nocardioides sp.]|uniref:HesB/IscA family protein n=1 Tax=Nocardioides sp. TaxID=35761 RepID=UPI003517824D
MLALTDNAATLVREMTDGPEVPDTAGLRITAAAGGFAVSATPRPEEGDRVVHQDGVVVYLDAEAADRLDEMTLDADVDASGDLRFELLPRRWSA